MRRNEQKEAQKAAQLCAQVREALSLSLAAIEDDVMLDLFVLDVTPAPDAGRLRVTVGAGDEYTRDEILERVDHHMSALRAEVASSIHRKKTPTLVFEVLKRPPSSGD